MVGVTENRSEHGKRDGVIVDCAEGNGRGLDRGEVYGYVSACEGCGNDVEMAKNMGSDGKEG